MMWTIAFETLVADRGKMLTAMVGVVFSVVLVNIQGGLFVGLVRKAGLLVDAGQAEVWVGHQRMHNVDFPRDVPYRYIDRLRAVPAVRRAEPYLIGFSDMTLPNGGFEGVVVVGASRATLLGNAWNVVEGRPDDILRPDSVIVDRSDMQKLEHPALGEVREIGGRRARIVAMSDGITGFLVAPYVFTTHETAARYLHKPLDVCSYFLVELKPGYSAADACRMIEQQLPELDVMPKEEYSRVSIDFWMTRTGLGISFGAATLLGLLVGMIMVGQTLYAMVLDRLPEFGALRAIGASERQIYSILFSQSLTMATVGSVIGLMLVAAIQYGFHSPRAPIVIPAWLSLGSCMIVLVICMISSLLPYQRVRKIDPMMVLLG